MSKQALTLLLKDLTAKVGKIDAKTGKESRVKDQAPTDYFRESVLNKTPHMIDFRATSITTEITAELAARDPESLAKLTRPEVTKAALALRKSLLAQTKPEDIVGGGRYLVQPNYRQLQTKLAKANEAAITVLNDILATKGATNTTVSKSFLTQPDHVNTNAEIKFARDFSRRVDNPLQTIKALASAGHLKTADVATIVEKNFTKIISHYTTGNTKAFDLTVGSIVQVRSGYVNMQEGSTDVKARAKAIREAVEKAIKDTNWSEQNGSDSYRDALFKELDNIAVKSGGKGRKKRIDKQSNKVSQEKTTTKKVVVVKPVAQIKKQKPAPQAQPSRFSLQSVVNFINARLPEAIRANMNPPGLVNRTGRFSESARVVGGVITPQGFPSLGYTYDRKPYDVFDPILGAQPWNIPSRDPRKLVERSIRDIAQELAIGRFYLRRT